MPREEIMSVRTKKRWIASVKTVSTYPPPGLFTKCAATIARTLASREVSPKGPGSGMRMLTFFINRAGKGLTAERRAELEKAKVLLSQRIHRDRKARRKKAALTQA
jgi:tRNA(adenine34) deaminase